MPDLEVKIIKIQTTMGKEQNSQESQKQALNIPIVRRSRLSPEDIFLKDIKSLINNFFIDNPNYNNDYYFKESDTMNTLKLIKDTKDRAKYILERIDSIDHLVKME